MRGHLGSLNSVASPRFTLFLATCCCSHVTCTTHRAPSQCTHQLRMYECRRFIRNNATTPVAVSSFLVFLFAESNTVPKIVPVLTNFLSEIDTACIVNVQFHNLPVVPCVLKVFRHFRYSTELDVQSRRVSTAVWIHLEYSLRLPTKGRPG